MGYKILSLVLIASKKNKKEKNYLQTSVLPCTACAYVREGFF